MRFDYTHGKSAKYLVSLYGWNVEDKYYCETYKDAKSIYNSIKEKYHLEGTALSLYDLVRDIRLQFIKY